MEEEMGDEDKKGLGEKGTGERGGGVDGDDKGRRGLRKDKGRWEVG